MIIGGKTQFFTAAQGMPKTYEKYLTKHVRTFLWDSEAPPPITSNLMSLPHKTRGRNILDIPSQNNAIKIMKLKRILNYSESRPMASDAAIAIIIGSLPKPLIQDVDVNTISNIFLQTVHQRQCYISKTLPKSIQDILNTGAKYNLMFDAPKLTQNHKLGLPAWYHIGKTPGTRNRVHNPKAKCLRLVHEVKTTANLIAQETFYENPDHKENNHCMCPPCETYHNKGCPHPNSCFKEAGQQMQDLSPKFNPYKDDHLLTEQTTPQDKKAAQEHAIGPPGEVKIFNQDVSSSGEIHKNFRIFTNPIK